ncbi:MAG: hypothetical protein F6K47_03540 [Symploca sp. SIO2E6]|nr:hypothetical protein [Symploca sp. SIO2E6]
MVISTKSTEIDRYNWGQEELNKILNQYDIDNQDKIINFYRLTIARFNQNNPKLTGEFNQAVRETLTIALSGLVIDSSMIVSPLAWFANKYDSEDIVESCNQLINQIFKLQSSKLSIKYGSNKATEMIEF